MDFMVLIRSPCISLVNIEKNLMVNRKELLTRMLSNVSEYRCHWTSLVNTGLCLLRKTHRFLLKVSVFVCARTWMGERVCACVLCESVCFTGLNTLPFLHLAAY